MTVGALLGEALGWGVGTPSKYDGAWDGDTVGAADGLALGCGVGDAAVVNVSIVSAAIVTAVLTVTVLSVSSTDTTDTVPVTPVPVTVDPTCTPVVLDTVIVVLLPEVEPVVVVTSTEV